MYGVRGEVFGFAVRPIRPTTSPLPLPEDLDHRIEMILHRFFGGATVARFQRGEDFKMFDLRTVWHVLRRIVHLQATKHRAVAVAEQVGNDKRIGWISTGLPDADVE